MPGMEPLSPIQEVSAEGSRSPETSKSGDPEQMDSDPQAELSWYAPLRPMKPAVALPATDDLIDLSTETNPFSGFRPASPVSHKPPMTTPSRLPPAPLPRQSTPVSVDALNFLAGAGFLLEDPALAPVLRDSAVVSALARSLQQALTIQEKELSIASPAHASREGRREGSVVQFADEVGSQTTTAYGGAQRAARQQAASTDPPSRTSAHRLPEGIVGGLSFDRPLGPDDRGNSQSRPLGASSQPRDPRTSSISPGRPLFESRSFPQRQTWGQDVSGPRGPAPPGVQFHPELMHGPESVAGSYGTSQVSHGGGWQPRINPSVRYAGGPSRDKYESFIFDLQRVFRSYPPHVPEPSKIAFLGGQLDGDAQIYFNSKDWYLSSWQTVCEAFQTRFLPLATPEITWQKFWQVMQYDQKAKKERPISEVIQESKEERAALAPTPRADGPKKRVWTASQVLSNAFAVDASSSKSGRAFRTGAADNRGGKLSAKQLAQHLRDGLCFGCSQPGHVKTQCPRRQQASSHHSEPVNLMDEENSEEGVAEAHGVSLVGKAGLGSSEGRESRALPLKLMIPIGGKLAYTLVDDGCTHNLIKPSFVKLHRLAYHQYPEPLSLKQTTVGSKGSINHWAQLDTQSPSGEVLSSKVFQLVALDKYDAFVSMDWIKRNLLVHRDTFAVWANGEVQVGEGTFDRQEASHIGERYARALVGEFLPVSQACASQVLPPGLARDESGLVIASDKVPLQTRQQLTSLLEEFVDVFQDGASEELPPLRPGMNHRIPLIDESLTPNTRLYKMPDAFLTQFYVLAEKHLKSGTWVRGVATGASSIMARPKPSDPSKARFVSDLRQRNANTVKDQNGPPDQEAIRNEVCRTIQRKDGICTAFDFPDGYHQIRTEPEDVHKTATRTPIGIILWQVMQQGDTNAGATFQRDMVITFEGGEQIGVMVYLDNIYIHSRIEDHVEALRWVLVRLRKHQWKVSFAKAEIARDDLEVLGFRINAEGIHVDERKAWDIIQHPEPKDVKQLQSFLGMVNYLADRMPEVALLSAPLSEIAVSGARFLMTPARKEAFVRVKELVSKTVALSPISAGLADSGEPSGKVWVVADASVSGVGGWIGQGNSHDVMRPAGFFSKKYTAAQSNWATPDQELLALIATLNAFRRQLLGVPVTLVTDSQTASRLRDKAELRGKSWRWDDFLSEFYVRDIIHVPRTRNKVSDYLSKLSGEYPEAFTSLSDEVCDPCRRDDEDGQLSFHGEPIAPIESAAAETVDIKANPGWQDAYALDRVFCDVIAHPDQYSSLYRWVSDTGMLHVVRPGEPDLVAVPDQMRNDVIRQEHGGVGHQGVRYTLQAIRRNYWWGSMVKDVVNFCAECDACQRSKTSSQSPPGFLRSLTVPRGAWKHVAIDFVGPFPAGKSRNDFLMVTIDRSSTQVRLSPCKTKLTGEGAAELYLRKIYVLHGWPSSVVSDRDQRFTGAFWQGLMRSTGVDLKMSTAAHPETDGQAEAANKTVVQILPCLLLERRLPQADWEQLVPHVELAMNSSINRSLGMTPFDFVYGETPSGFPTPTSSASSTSSDAAAFVERLSFLRDWAWDGVVAARTAQTKQANKLRRDDPGYQVGDRVLLSTTNLRLREEKKRPWASKLLPKWVGPFVVVRSASPSYELELPAWLRVHPTFHTKLLKAWNGSDSDTIAPRHEAFESDLVPTCVVDYRDVGVGIGSRREFLVKWKRSGDGPSPADTWENADHVVAHFPDLPADLTQAKRTRRSTRAHAS
ncbi:hypothetical protein CF327_g7435 [Tilletia walkeri]|nr:hypothetical protein CF327_g7435 [Tilletia walkeri]